LFPAFQIHPPYIFTRVVGSVRDHDCIRTTPTITVTSPANNWQTTSPVNYAATASSPDCAQGISAIRIYSRPYVSA
jgi:hypothetical protein